MPILNLQQTIDYITQIYKTIYDNSDNDINQFTNCIHENIKENNPTAIQDLETFINDQQMYIARREYQIPNGILPDTKIGFLYDVNVHISKDVKKQQQRINNHTLLTDDYVYKNFPLIQQKIPRGVTICKIIDKDDNNNIDFYETCIYGNKNSQFSNNRLKYDNSCNNFSVKIFFFSHSLFQGINSNSQLRKIRLTL